ncbi:sphinganine kinase lcb4 [Orbilia oligospora]|uniref:Sphinganine kinase lcb4 n=1 Tax=Orbilia oligospora TaxID=2813651 RepID=A0A6G1LYB0_ORBOL|nr:sphinganine kinase lcb4 [Orbilia oligospora]KAF3216062.1 sphinganine kinase lcb4 [Orbilia oligospora]KAF3238768.1 sphinganine kinase lcb4 [Orbilia oligospora]
MSSEHQGLVTSTSHDGVAISPEDALLLDTHSLIIREDRVTIADKRKSSKKRDASCCGIAGTGKPSDELVTLHNILWARVYISEDKSAVQITSAKELSRSQQAKRFKVLINPHGGPGTAEKIYKTEIEPIFAAASCHIDVERTEYSQHAIKIAQELDIEAYDAVVCISGDGVPHEVFNGLARRPDARKALNKIAVCQLPGGSGNGMCWSFTGTDAPSLAAVALVKGKRTPFDLVSVTQGDKRILSFLSQSVGLTAELDLGTENMRWMGNTRFTVGFLQRVITERIYPSEIHVKLAIESKEEIRRNASTVRLPPDGEHEYEGLPPLQYGTVNDPVPDDWVAEPHPKMGNFYCGNMICMSKDIHFFPAAKPNDGHMDLATMDGDVGRLKAVGVMLGAETGKHFDIPELNYRKVLAYRFTPKNQKDGYISIDGEKVAFAPFQAEIHHGLGVSLSLRPNVYEGPTLV